MYSVLNVLKQEPVVIAGAVIAVINVFQLLGVLSLDGDQLAAINTALVAVLSLLVRQAVTPVSNQG